MSTWKRLDREGRHRGNGHGVLASCLVDMMDRLQTAKTLSRAMRANDKHGN